MAKHLLGNPSVGCSRGGVALRSEALSNKRNDTRVVFYYEDVHLARPRRCSARQRKNDRDASTSERRRLIDRDRAAVSIRNSFGYRKTKAGPTGVTNPWPGKTLQRRFPLGWRNSATRVFDNELNKFSIQIGRR